VHILADLAQEELLGSILPLIHQDEGFTPYVDVIFTAVAAGSFLQCIAGKLRNMARFSVPEIMVTIGDLFRNCVVVGMDDKVVFPCPYGAQLRINQESLWNFRRTVYIEKSVCLVVDHARLVIARIDDLVGPGRKSP